MVDWMWRIITDAWLIVMTVWVFVFAMGAAAVTAAISLGVVMWAAEAAVSAVKITRGPQ